MTVTGKAKVVQYLGEAHAADQAWAGLLKGHISMTPSGNYRAVLERQRNASERHAKKVQQRLAALGQGSDHRNLIGTGVAAITGLLGQAVAVGRAPVSLIRGGSGEEKMLHNAIEEAGQLQRTISTYRSLARLAEGVDDEATAELATSVADEKDKGLADLHEALPTLVGALIRADVQGKSTYDVSRTGAGQTASRLVEQGKEAVKDSKEGIRTEAKQARKVPGVAQAEGAIKGAVADADDLAISNYDDLTAEEIIGHLGALSQIDLAKVGAYEAKSSNRSTILDRVSSLAGDEPWPGYDDQTVVDVRKGLSGADDRVTREVLTYERRHKNRSGVIETAEGALANS